MFAFQLLSALSSAALLVAATPAGRAHDHDTCSTAAAKMDLPANQTQLVSPTTDPLFVMLGVGVQNYTCILPEPLLHCSTISCLDTTPAFGVIQTLGFDFWKALPARVTADDLGAKIGPPLLLGFHYFVTSPSGTGLSPKWDFTSTGRFSRNSSAFVLGAKVGDITAPADPAVNIDWLALNNAEGSLASKIFRIDTVNGQPPHL
ncbi:hypothetical protein B0H16DRAFT_1734715 [Mycena metata]|uniref:Malate dehydrogenase n=1 Tax=Mycena metata TaxID=1033252 RepID=A0AAD7HU14_9AGAR|nr:hypothetical protein B0H16DRAFT_1734715 [Mycena metata]